jgi:hypothetical protein
MPLAAEKTPSLPAELREKAFASFGLAVPISSDSPNFALSARRGHLGLPVAGHADCNGHARTSMSDLNCYLPRALVLRSLVRQKHFFAIHFAGALTRRSV